MTIVQAECTSFRKEKYECVHDFTTDTFKMAIYVAEANLGHATTVYTTDGEVDAAGTGYTAGGYELTIIPPAVAEGGDGRTVVISWEDVIVSPSTMTGAGCLIYNASKGNKAVAVYPFDAVRTSDNGPFIVKVPAVAFNTAVFRDTGA